MGHGRWDSSSYKSYAASASTRDRHELYTRSSHHDVTESKQAINIEDIGFRESRDSEDNPVSTPIIIGLDVTGSMGMIPEKLTKGALGTLVEQTLQRKPVTDPHMCFLGIGDACAGDRAPLQATQFEADNTICVQLTDLFLEGGGGGNNFESYDLAWAFAVGKCQTDAWEKRQAKGMLFTIGDEMFPKRTNVEYVAKRVLGQAGEDTTPESLLTLAQERYHVFHVIIAQGHFAGSRLNAVESDWQQRLGKRALTCHSYDKLAELMVSAMAIENGEEVEDVLDWWDDDTAAVVAKAIRQ